MTPDEEFAACPGDPDGGARRAGHAPPRARAVVVLRYWEDLSVDQTAVVLGCSPGNVKSLAAGALGKLRVVLDEALTGCDPAESHPEEHHEAKGTRHG